jgi:hypothetical protein
MKRTLLALCCLTAVAGCGSASSYVHSDATLGRVVIYRNGIAYFERTARVENGTLKLSVPADKVDDFLKSLTVVDARTGEPAPIAYPTKVPSEAAGLIDMNIALQGSAPHDLRLSYVTEAPSWKPSYRVVLGDRGRVTMQGWAIVDNTSGEDWQNVQLGVGSSSALSFRYDLQSVRVVRRETLQSDNLFALAPPTGGAAYAQGKESRNAQGQRILSELSDDHLAMNALPPRTGEKSVADESKKSPPRDMTGGQAGHGARRARSLDQRPPAASSPPKPAEQEAPFDNLARSLSRSKNTIIVEGFADRSDADKNASSLERANRAREQLIRQGVDPNRVMAVGRGEEAGRGPGVRVVEGGFQTAGAQVPKETPGQLEPTEPIGTSHFESKGRMSVPRGTSAMVSILNSATKGEVVYYFDPESQRGSGSFAFKAVRLQNPTDSQLESGPVTVFGNGKFIGEGLSEPIPPRSMAFVPFALDRQVVIEKKESEADRIARILTVQRGVFSTEVQHTKRSTLVIHNRLGEPVTVYVRHTVPRGFKLTAPASSERLGLAHLFPVRIAAHDKAEMVIEEETPLFRTADIRSSSGLELVTAYLSSAALDGPLKAAFADLLRLHKEMANLEQQISTVRETQQEYRTRMDELHAQIVTLRAVKTAGPLMGSLERKLSEVSDRMSKSTIELVALQEKLMVSRIRFQDGVADLSLEKKNTPPSSGSAPTKAASRN